MVGVVHGSGVDGVPEKQIIFALAADSFPPKIIIIFFNLKLPVDDPHRCVAVRLENCELGKA